MESHAGLEISASYRSTTGQKSDLPLINKTNNTDPIDRH